MSDLAWVIFFIVLYLVIIKPMLQGILQIPKSKATQNPNKSNTTAKKASTRDNSSEYVDYEEVE